MALMLPPMTLKVVRTLACGLTSFLHELCLQGHPKANEVTNEQLKSEPKAENFLSYKSRDTDTQMIDQLPQVEKIGTILFWFSDTLFPDQTAVVTLFASDNGGNISHSKIISPRAIRI